MGEKNSFTVDGQAVIMVDASLPQCPIDTAHLCSGHRVIVEVTIRYHDRDIQLFPIYILPAIAEEERKTRFHGYSTRIAQEIPNCLVC